MKAELYQCPKLSLLEWQAILILPRLSLVPQYILEKQSLDVDLIRNQYGFSTGFPLTLSSLYSLCFPCNCVNIA